ncbi:hypothetical protein AVEN_29413-1 [Araneus ventricosus]|uniref:Uncharacterized protein n=1 Tax=Araneus ventricosus TaxID=182803 RepID=A0A4Y2D0D6_ARAVE|nr:hypothetical protein AVEN_29413-1 [Araneus ventricosus]
MNGKTIPFSISNTSQALCHSEIRSEKKGHSIPSSFHQADWTANGAAQQIRTHTANKAGKKLHHYGIFHLLQGTEFEFDRKQKRCFFANNLWLLASSFQKKPIRLAKNFLSQWTGTPKKDR